MSHAHFFSILFANFRKNQQLLNFQILIASLPWYKQQNTDAQISHTSEIEGSVHVTRLWPSEEPSAKSIIDFKYTNVAI